MRAVAIEEVGGDTALVLLEVAKPVAGVQPAFAEPGAHRLMYYALQPAPVYRELRDVITRVSSAWLAPDLLAEPVGVDQLKGADRDRIEPLHQPQLLKFFNGMRQGVDADSELADAIGLLEQLAVDPTRVQHQRCGEAPDAASDDDDLHSQRPLTSLRSRIIG